MFKLTKIMMQDTKSLLQHKGRCMLPTALRLKTLHMQRLSHLQEEDVAGSTKGNSPNQHGLKGWQCTLK